ncbi:LOW QUALITY PROTEIN: integrin alpha-5-like, partial [Passer montanus]|uniref:LOW QUALITY PROTEIN: integrin alpha-5-like n=1 Tax=Passer montanus TaxID=9160 RepID=UPI00195FD43A
MRRLPGEAPDPGPCTPPAPPCTRGRAPRTGDSGAGAAPSPGSPDRHGPLLLPLLLPPVAAFNLEASRPVVFRGAPGSFFGFALDFYLPEPRSVSILVGAPKANTSQPNVTQGGAVFHCPWPPAGGCAPIDFDHIGGQGQGQIPRNGDRPSSEGAEPVEFKSLQWFGATVRAHNGSILACAPLYSWSPPKEEGGAREPVGSCFLSLGNFSKFVEYAPCRSVWGSRAGRSPAQGSPLSPQTGRVLLGGPGSYFWQGQVMSATQEQIAAGNFPEYLIQEVPGQLQTRQAEPSHDDSYMGYSVTVGEFSGDTTQDFVAGVPKGNLTYGYVRGTRGTRGGHGGHWGGRAARTHFVPPRLTALLVGAPLFMARSGVGGARELGRVYVYLHRGGGLPAPPAPLTGQHEFGRFGSAIAALGDLDRDGYNGTGTGTGTGGLSVPSVSPQCPLSVPSVSPVPTDLLVGAFGADAAVVYRGRPIVHASASLAIVPSMFNPEERGCALASGHHASCINVTFCLNASGRHLPGPIGLALELSADGAKAGGARRALFLGGGAGGAPPSPTRNLTLEVPNGGTPRCHTLPVILRNESEFRDKLSPIALSLSLALDPAVSPPPPGLSPLLSPATRTRLEAKAHIQLDCEDNVCVPDLQLEASADRRAVFLGDRNSLNVTFQARNVGEGGAYEAELHVRPPPGALYSGVLRPHGIWGGLRFTLPHLSDGSSSVRFELQIR